MPAEGRKTEYLHLIDCFFNLETNQMKKMLFLLGWQIVSIFASGQFSIKGIVTGEGNEPLPGATVLLENSYYGVSTGTDGVFQFSRLKSGEYTLSVSYIGYEPVTKRILLDKDCVVVIQMTPRTIYTEEVLVSATKAHGKMPVAYSDVSRETLQGIHSGQDLPFLLAGSPSFVPTSDAGNGIGYTSFRIRGTDLTRINVMVNGIPLNDAESHITYFVDQPDLASSGENIQIQRGAGTSANGGAAFGATINMQTLKLNTEPYGSVQSSAGSFNTLKNTISAGTGLIDKKFSLDVRLSEIHSDGFIDRAMSNLKSYFISGGYYSAQTLIKVNIWTGWEETYQAWNGVPSVRLKNDIAGMKLYGEHGLYSENETAEMIVSGSRTYNLYTYENQVDHYQQDHYQLHFSHRFSSSLHLNTALHYTLGRGYYEEYKYGQKFGNYGLPKPVINGTEMSRTDLIRRKWLDNDFYGMVFSLLWQKNKLECAWGGGWNRYEGRHFGKVVWADYSLQIPPDYEWYRNKGTKTDFNNYAKVNWSLTKKLNLYADLQFRGISYGISGNDDDLRVLDQQHDYHFLNPKAGVYFQPDASNAVYLSFARTNREPNRDNFTDTPPGGKLPEAETLNDWETGWNFRSVNATFSANFFAMQYHNQLALTGQINDVGAPVMTNVKKSYRTGLELQWGIRILPVLRWDANATFSRNKITGFTEFVDDWDTGAQKSFFMGNTDLAFSPLIVGNSGLTWNPGRLSMKLVSSFTGKQFIDNTSSGDRILDPYFISNLNVDYNIKTKFFKAFTCHLMINNLLNAAYESNAWVYSYYYGGNRFKMDGYFPQAGINFMCGITVTI
jgi:iron complex outermembrane recepter protein